MGYELSEFEYEVLKRLKSGEVESFRELDPASYAAAMNMVRGKLVRNYASGVFMLLPSHELALMEFEQRKDKEQNNATSVFNIGTVNNSVAGIGNTITVNYESALADIKEKVSDYSGDDKAELNQIINLLEMMLDNQVPVTKGLLSKFSGVMENHSWLTGSIASALLGWLTTALH